MPIFRQSSIGFDAVGELNKFVPPVADARAGTTNPAGGLVVDIDARGYKSGTLYCMAGVMATSATLNSKVQAATASGGSYSDISGAATEAFDATDDNLLRQVDFEIPAGKPFLSIVMVATETGTISASWIVLNHKMRS